jgi:hypothetical protein
MAVLMTAPFELMTDTPTSKTWHWNGYLIQWEPIPDDGSWDEDWEYLLTYAGPNKRNTACGFPSLAEAVAYAIEDNDVEGWPCR